MKNNNNKKIVASILSIIQFVNINVGICLEKPYLETKSQMYESHNVETENQGLSELTYCDKKKLIKLHNITYGIMFSIFGVVGILKFISKKVEHRDPCLFSSVHNKLDYIFEFINIFRKSSKEKLENLNLVMVLCNASVCSNSDQSNEKKIKILESFLDNLLKIDFKYKDIDVPGLHDSNVNCKFSYNLKKFYDNMRLVCNIDKLSEESEDVKKQGVKVLEKLNNWKKKMDDNNTTSKK